MRNVVTGAIELYAPSRLASSDNTRQSAPDDSASDFNPSSSSSWTTQPSKPAQVRGAAALLTLGSALEKLATPSSSLSSSSSSPSETDSRFHTPSDDLLAFAVAERATVMVASVPLTTSHVAPNGTVKVPVSFSPHYPKLVTVVHLDAWVGDSLSTSIPFVAHSGVAKVLPSRTSLNFKSVAIGGHKVLPLRLFNTGGIPSSFTVSCPERLFAFEPSSGIIPSQSSVTIQVTYSPLHHTSVDALVTVTYQSLPRRPQNQAAWTSFDGGYDAPVVDYSKVDYISSYTDPHLSSTHAASLASSSASSSSSSPAHIVPPMTTTFTVHGSGGIPHLMLLPRDLREVYAASAIETPGFAPMAVKTLFRSGIPDRQLGAFSIENLIAELPKPATPSLTPLVALVCALSPLSDNDYEMPVGTLPHSQPSPIHVPVINEGDAEGETIIDISGPSSHYVVISPASLNTVVPSRCYSAITLICTPPAPDISSHRLSSPSSSLSSSSTSQDLYSNYPHPASTRIDFTVIISFVTQSVARRTIRVMGTIGGPMLVVDPPNALSNLDFGVVDSGQRHMRRFEVINTGTTDAYFRVAVFAKTAALGNTAIGKARLAKGMSGERGHAAVTPSTKYPGYTEIPITSVLSPNLDIGGKSTSLRTRNYQPHSSLGSPTASMKQADSWPILAIRPNIGCFRKGTRTTFVVEWAPHADIEQLQLMLTLEPLFAVSPEELMLASIANPRVPASIRFLASLLSGRPVVPFLSVDDARLETLERSVLEQTGMEDPATTETRVAELSVMSSASVVYANAKKLAAAMDEGMQEAMDGLLAKSRLAEDKESGMGHDHAFKAMFASLPLNEDPGLSDNMANVARAAQRLRTKQSSPRDNQPTYFSFLAQFASTAAEVSRQAGADSTEFEVAAAAAHELTSRIHAKIPVPGASALGEMGPLSGMMKGATGDPEVRKKLKDMERAWLFKTFGFGASRTEVEDFWAEELLRDLESGHAASREIDEEFGVLVNTNWQRDNTQSQTKAHNNNNVKSPTGSGQGKQTKTFSPDPSSTSSGAVTNESSDNGDQNDPESLALRRHLRTLWMTQHKRSRAAHTQFPPLVGHIKGLAGRRKLELTSPRRVIDFGVCGVGDVFTQTIELTNPGNIEYEFSIEPDSSDPYWQSISAQGNTEATGRKGAIMSHMARFMAHLSNVNVNFTCTSSDLIAAQTVNQDALSNRAQRRNQRQAQRSLLRGAVNPGALVPGMSSVQGTAAHRVYTQRSFIGMCRPQQKATITISFAPLREFSLRMPVLIQVVGGLSETIVIQAISVESRLVLYSSPTTPFTNFIDINVGQSQLASTITPSLRQALEKLTYALQPQLNATTATAAAASIAKAAEHRMILSKAASTDSSTSTSSSSTSSSLSSSSSSSARSISVRDTHSSSSTSSDPSIPASTASETFPQVIVSLPLIDFGLQHLNQAHTRTVYLANQGSLRGWFEVARDIPSCFVVTPLEGEVPPRSSIPITIAYIASTAVSTEFVLKILTHNTRLSSALSEAEKLTNERSPPFTGGNTGLNAYLSGAASVHATSSTALHISPGLPGSSSSSQRSRGELGKTEGIRISGDSVSLNIIVRAHGGVGRLGLQFLSEHESVTQGLDFGTVAVNTVVEKVFCVLNKGSVPLKCRIDRDTGGFTLGRAGAVQPLPSTVQAISGFDLESPPSSSTSSSTLSKGKAKVKSQQSDSLLKETDTTGADIVKACQMLGLAQTRSRRLVSSLADSLNKANPLSASGSVNSMFLGKGVVANAPAILGGTSTPQAYQQPSTGPVPTSDMKSHLQLDGGAWTVDSPLTSTNSSSTSRQQLPIWGSGDGQGYDVDEDMLADDDVLLRLFSQPIGGSRDADPKSSSSSSLSSASLSLPTPSTNNDLVKRGRTIDVSDEEGDRVSNMTGPVSSSSPLAKARRMASRSESRVYRSSQSSSSSLPVSLMHPKLGQISDDMSFRTGAVSVLTHREALLHEFGLDRSDLSDPTSTTSTAATAMAEAANGIPFLDVTIPAFSYLPIYCRVWVRTERRYGCTITVSSDTTSYSFPAKAEGGIVNLSHRGHLHFGSVGLQRLYNRTLTLTNNGSAPCTVAIQWVLPRPLESYVPRRNVDGTFELGPSRNNSFMDSQRGSRKDSTSTQSSSQPSSGRNSFANSIDELSSATASAFRVSESEVKQSAYVYRNVIFFPVYREERRLSHRESSPQKARQAPVSTSYSSLWDSRRSSASPTIAVERRESLASHIASRRPTAMGALSVSSVSSTSSSSGMSSFSSISRERKKDVVIMSVARLRWQAASKVIVRLLKIYRTAHPEAYTRLFSKEDRSDTTAALLAAFKRKQSNSRTSSASLSTSSPHHVAMTVQVPKSDPMHTSLLKLHTHGFEVAENMARISRLMDARVDPAVNGPLMALKDLAKALGVHLLSGSASSKSSSDSIPIVLATDDGLIDPSASSPVLEASRSTTTMIPPSSDSVGTLVDLTTGNSGVGEKSISSLLATISTVSPHVRAQLRAST